MTENTTTTTTEPTPVDALERVTICTDGGVGGRGSTTVVYLTSKDARELAEAALDRRRA
ncbi:hypothetical protein ABGB18_11140 [Nonomuraea sp. B12E4]|uniref:hypothetical protein n=1 Tax=Nonomuraea sp. B12E4 TaxID=3153564 RepID=UPI00325F1905